MLLCYLSSFSRSNSTTLQNKRNLILFHGCISIWLSEFWSGIFVCFCNIITSIGESWCGIFIFFIYCMMCSFLCTLMMTFSFETLIRVMMCPHLLCLLKLLVFLLRFLERYELFCTSVLFISIQYWWPGFPVSQLNPKLSVSCAQFL